MTPGLRKREMGLRKVENQAATFELGRIGETFTGINGVGGDAVASGNKWWPGIHIYMVLALLSVRARPSLITSMF